MNLHQSLQIRHGFYKWAERIALWLSLLFFGAACAYAAMGLCALFFPNLFWQFVHPMESTYYTFNIPLHSWLLDNTFLFPLSIYTKMLIVICYSIIITQYGLISMILYCFKKILQSLSDQDPFRASNVKHIERIGLLLICLTFLGPFLSSAIFSGIYGITGYFRSFNYWMGACGIFLLIVAKVFRYGRFLQIERDETL